MISGAILFVYLMCSLKISSFIAFGTLAIIKCWRFDILLKALGNAAFWKYTTFVIFFEVCCILVALVRFCIIQLSEGKTWWAGWSKVVTECKVLLLRIFEFWEVHTDIGVGLGRGLRWTGFGNTCNALGNMGVSSSVLGLTEIGCEGNWFGGRYWFCCCIW